MLGAADDLSYAAARGEVPIEAAKAELNEIIIAMADRSRAQSLALRAIGPT
ncbi:hypothetical protein [Stappia sp.]|uniref:hypothetical protein n=1 Tax=Stappia sp. TaxID=1870903 RepID=UPI003A99B329